MLTWKAKEPPSFDPKIFQRLPRTCYWLIRQEASEQFGKQYYVEDRMVGVMRILGQPEQVMLLSVVRLISDDICVMYLGQLVETCPSKELFKNPLHPYTQALISAVPTTDIHHKKERILLEGEITSPIHPKPGCRFGKRCTYACKKCHEPQQLEEILPNHFVACCRVKEINTL